MINIKTTVSFNAEGNITEYGTFNLPITEIAWLEDYGYSLEYELDGKKSHWWDSRFRKYRSVIENSPQVRPSYIFKQYVDRLNR